MQRSLRQNERVENLAENTFAALLDMSAFLSSICMMHTLGAQAAAKYGLALTKRRKAAIAAKLAIGILIMAALAALLFGFAAYTVTKSYEISRQAWAISAVVTVVVSMIGYQQCSEYAKSVRDHADAWNRHEDGSFETHVTRSVHSIYFNNGVLYSILAGGLQLGLLVALARDPKMSANLKLAHSAEFERAGMVSVSCIALLTVGLYLFSRYFSPSQILVESIFRFYKTFSSSPSPGLSIRIARWRTEYHKLGFRAAENLLRALSGLRNKLTPDDFARVDETYRAVAYALRKRSIELNSDAFDDYFASLCFAAAALAVSDNPLEARRKAEEIVGADSPRVPPRDSRIARWLTHLDGALQQYSKVLLVAVGTFVVLALILSGQFGKTLEFLQQVASPK